MYKNRVKYKLPLFYLVNEEIQQKMKRENSKYIDDVILIFPALGFLVQKRKEQQFQIFFFRTLPPEIP